MHADWMGVLFCAKCSRDEVNERGGMRRKKAMEKFGVAKISWKSESNASAIGGA